MIGRTASDLQTRRGGLAGGPDCVPRRDIPGGHSQEWIGDQNTARQRDNLPEMKGLEFQQSDVSLLHLSALEASKKTPDVPTIGPRAVHRKSPAANGLIPIRIRGRQDIQMVEGGGKDLVAPG
jgi:hypothetical protein